MNHWASQYIGIEWKFGGQNPQQGFDCWGLFRYTQEAHYGLNLADIEVKEKSVESYMDSVKGFEAHQEEWIEVDTPIDGDGVLLRKAKYPHHVGIWIVDGENQGILHAVKAGVVFSSRSNLRTSGWKIVKFYRHKTKWQT